MPAGHVKAASAAAAPDPEREREPDESVAWIRAARGAADGGPGPSPLDGLDAFLKPYGYGRDDASRMPWLCAAVLASRGALRAYVEETGGDLAGELSHSLRDAAAAMAGEEPTAGSLRHDLRNRDFRPRLDAPRVQAAGADK